MKPPEEARRALVEQWLLKADQDFRVARHLFVEGALYPVAIGFHCQQSAEKHLKNTSVLYLRSSALIRG